MFLQAFLFSLKVKWSMSQETAAATSAAPSRWVCDRLWPLQHTYWRIKSCLRPTGGVKVKPSSFDNIEVKQSWTLLSQKLKNLVCTPLLLILHSRRHMRTYFSPDGRPNTTSSFRVQTALTRRPPSTSLSRRYHPRVGVGLEIFGASTGTTVSSKGDHFNPHTNS